MHPRTVVWYGWVARGCDVVLVGGAGVRRATVGFGPARPIAWPHIPSRAGMVVFMVRLRGLARCVV
eukprot:364965-Chlamydomonas_euryale.AAC.22